jgi:phosphatidylinositol alpha-1,6-mannosyltransferase
LHRLYILLFFLTRPKEFQNVFENVNKLYPYLRNLDFDLLLSANSGWIFPLTFVLSKIFNRKIITMAHGSDFLIRNPLTLKTYYFKNTNQIIVSSNLMKNYIKKIHHLDKNQISVIYRALDLKEFKIQESNEEIRENFNISPDQFIILSVGRHIVRKQFDFVIRAISKIIVERPLINVKYYLIGEGKETPNLKNLVNKLKLNDKVVFLGASDDLTKKKFYKISDLFVMPSITDISTIEGFGIVFLEANYYKVPVIGTETGGVIEAIINEKTGLLIEPNNLNDLVEKILYLFDNKSLRIKMGETGRNRVLNEFNWDKIFLDYINIFKKVLNK